MGVMKEKAFVHVINLAAFAFPALHFSSFYTSDQDSG